MGCRCVRHLATAMTVAAGGGALDDGTKVVSGGSVLSSTTKSMDRRLGGSGGANLYPRWRRSLASHPSSSAVASSGRRRLHTIFLRAAFSRRRRPSAGSQRRTSCVGARMRLRLRRRSCWAWDFCRPPRRKEEGPPPPMILLLLLLLGRGGSTTYDVGDEWIPSRRVGRGAPSPGRWGCASRGIALAVAPFSPSSTSLPPPSLFLCSPLQSSPRLFHNVQV